MTSDGSVIIAPINQETRELGEVGLRRVPAYVCATYRRRQRANVNGGVKILAQVSMIARRWLSCVRDESKSKE